MKKRSVTFRITKEEYAELEKAAVVDDRSVSDYIRVAIKSLIRVAKENGKKEKK